MKELMSILLIALICGISLFVKAATISSATIQVILSLLLVFPLTYITRKHVSDALDALLK